MKKFYVVMACVLGLSGLVGCASESSPNANRMNSFTASEAKIELGSYNEEVARYYTAEFKSQETDIIKGISASAEPYESLEVLKEHYAEQIENIQTKVEESETFPEVIVDEDDTGLRIHAELEDFSKMFSVNIYVDGAVQLLYATQWIEGDAPTDAPAEESTSDEESTEGVDSVDESKGPDFNYIAGEIQKYTGMQVSSADLANLQNQIHDVATGGSYSFVVADSAGTSGYYIAVTGYGTAMESWQLMAQRQMMSL